MPFKREPSPLQNTTKEIDGLKKKVGKLCDEANKVFKAKKEPKDKEVRAEKLRNEYEELQSELESVGEKLSNLKEEDEPSKVKNYENKKSTEEKRLTSFQEQLEKYKEYLEEAKEEEEEEEEVDDEESGTEDEEEEGTESEEEEGEEEEEDYTGLSRKEIQKKKEAKEKKEKEAKKNKEKEEKKKEKEKKKEDKKKEKEKEQKDKKKKDEEVQDEKSSKGKSRKDSEKKGKGDTKSDSEKDKLEEYEETDEEDDGEDDSEEEEEESVGVEQRKRKYDKQVKEEEESEDDDDDDDDEEDDGDDDADEEEGSKETGREIKGKKPEIKRPQIRSRLTSRKEEVEKKEEGDETDEEETDEEEESKVEGTKGKKEEDDNEDDDEDDENDDDDDDETDEDDESEESEDDTQEQGTMRQYEAIGDWSGVKKGDLSVKKGDVVTVIDARIDGWLQAENKDGQRGLVPINYFRVSNAYKGVQQDDGKAEEEEEEEFDEENSDFDETETKTPRSGKVLWKNIKKAVKETSVTDVLHAMGAVPAGFRESTLGKKKTQEEYTSINYLAPKLSASCVSYKDLFFDPDANKIRPRNVRIQRIVTLMACRQIPLPGMVEVTSRHVRIALYDGKKILSNIHTVRVQSVDKEQRTWNFQTRVTDNMKSLEFGDIFIRTNSSEGNIGILFELCITYVRTSTNEEGEFSCGWVHFPLYDQNGVPTPNKTHDLFVNGGRPDEKGVDVDPTVGRRGSTNPFRSLMSGNKQPRLVIKINAPSREQKDLLDTLPDVLVGNTLYIQYISFYRQILMDALLRDNMEPQSTELIHSPLLTHFPGVVEQPDFMDVLRTAWAERLKSAKRAEKRDQESMKELFQRVFLEHLYPLCHSASLPLVKFGDRENEKVRYEEIQRLLKIGKDKKLAFAALLSPDAVMEPFSIDEVAFNVIGPYCTNRHV